SNGFIAAIAVGSTFALLLIFGVIYVVIMLAVKRKNKNKFQRLDEEVDLKMMETRSTNSQSRTYAPGEYHSMVNAPTSPRFIPNALSGANDEKVLGDGRTVTVNNVLLLQQKINIAKAAKAGSVAGYQALDSEAPLNTDTALSSAIQLNLEDVTPQMIVEAKSSIPQDEASFSASAASLLTPTWAPSRPKPATGPATKLNSQRFYNPEQNSIIPLLAPIQSLTDPTKNIASFPTTAAHSKNLQTYLRTFLFPSLTTLPLDRPIPGTGGAHRVSPPQRQYFPEPPPPPGVDKLLFEVQYPFSPRRADEVCVSVGDIVVVEKVLKDGWVFGVNWSTAGFVDGVQGGAMGLFPLFVVEEGDSGAVEGRTDTVKQVVI
ncbi:hypothetical protein BCR33DRAFT_716457, partial [Rhizoclosmatium globosum]